MSGVNFSIPFKGKNVLTSKTQQLLNYQYQLPKITQELQKLLKEKQEYRNKSKSFINEEINKLTEAVGSFNKNTSNKILKAVQEKTAKSESSAIFNLISARKILLERIADLESNIYPVLEYLENKNQSMMYQTMNGPVLLSKQEAKNANNGFFPSNHREKHQLSESQREYQRKYDMEFFNPEFLRRLEQENKIREYERQLQLKHQKQLEHKKQLRREYRQRLRQKHQQKAEININNNNNFEDNNYLSNRTGRSITAKSKRSGLELERL
jgi:hypothetical protein